VTSSHPSSEQESKLSAGQIHMLKLLRKEQDADGWASVSKAVAPLFIESRVGRMPTALCEFERVGADGAGRARLTTEGNNVLNAMVWL
jgi:hypothetical protein